MFKGKDVRIPLSKIKSQKRFMSFWESSSRFRFWKIVKCSNFSFFWFCQLDKNSKFNPMRCYLSPIFDTHGAKECRQHRLSRPWCQCRSGCAQWIALRKRRRKRWQSCGRCRWGWPAPSVVSSSARLRPPAKKAMFFVTIWPFRAFSHRRHHQFIDLFHRSRDLQLRPVLCVLALNNFWKIFSPPMRSP